MAWAPGWCRHMVAWPVPLDQPLVLEQDEQGTSDLRYLLSSLLCGSSQLLSSVAAACACGVSSILLSEADVITAFARESTWSCLRPNYDSSRTLFGRRWLHVCPQFA